MNLRWLLFDHVPPELRLNAEQRRDLGSRIAVNGIPWSLRKEALCFGLGILLVMLWFAITNRIADLTTSWFGSDAGFLHLIWLWMGLWVIITGVNHLFARPRTYKALREMGYDTCLKCGYWLRGLAEDVTNCPECGAKREPMPEAGAEQPQMGTDQQGS
ncbi:MAG: hypothetical protein IIB53_05690 [Planctomycetes bacterium]|nr:hypothetical protein [Planctomycetota bacterium]MCH8259677.1 hypothetical protein [Planctomycetota bacterium]